MIVRSYADVNHSDRSVSAEGWTSVRMLLDEDEMGFSFHITTIHEGAELKLHYKHHLESVYCMSGSGSIEELESGVTHAIRPGVMYALNNNDPHILRATEEMQMACVFNPPVVGDEKHGPDGAYEPADKVKAKKSS